MASARRRRGTRFPTPAPARWTPRPAGSQRRWRMRMSSSENAHGRAIAARRRTASESSGVEAKSAARARAHLGEDRRACGRRGQFRGAAAALGAMRGLANRSDPVGRHFMNHNQLGGARDRSAHAQRFRLPEDDRPQRFLSRRRTGRSAARQYPACSAEFAAPILKSNVRIAPEWALDCSAAGPSTVYAMSEDLPKPESRVTRRRRPDRLDWKRSNWARAERSRRANSRSCCARPAIRSCSSSLSTAHAFASVRHGPHGRRSRRRRRSIRFAAPWIIQIFSLSTPRFCRPQRPSILR